MTESRSATLTIARALRIASNAQRDGQSGKAAAIYAQILASDPDNGDALHLMGHIEIDRARPDMAEPLLRRAAEKHPEIAAFKASLGKALHRLGRTDEAIGQAALALASSPNDPGIREVVNHVMRIEPTVDLLRLPDIPDPIRAEPAAVGTRKTLVIGIATGYPAAALRPFVLSLREHYGGPVHLVVDETAEIAALLDGHGIDWSPMTAGASHPVIHRFKLYRDLVESVDDGTRILLTDVFDVVFQGNPFEFSPAGPVVAVLEDATTTIGACPWNSDWMRTHFGPRMLERLADHQTSCAGTLLGDRAGLIDYLTQFCLLAGTLPVDGVYGLDMAIHGVLIHHQTVAGTMLLEHGWPIATVQPMPESSIGVVNGKIVLSDGRCPLVVHQYNRRAPMIELVRRYYGGQ